MIWVVYGSSHLHGKSAMRNKVDWQRKIIIHVLCKILRGPQVHWLKVRSQNLKEQFIFHLFRTCRWLGGGVFWINPSYIKQNKRIDHSIFVCSVTWTLNGSEARGDLFLIETSLFWLVNQVILILTMGIYTTKAERSVSKQGPHQPRCHLKASSPSRQL